MLELRKALRPCLANTAGCDVYSPIQIISTGEAVLQLQKELLSGPALMTSAELKVLSLTVSCSGSIACTPCLQFVSQFGDQQQQYKQQQQNNKQQPPQPTGMVVLFLRVHTPSCGLHVSMHAYMHARVAPLEVQFFSLPGASTFSSQLRGGIVRWSVLVADSES